jgi:hypothetical protein
VTDRWELERAVLASDLPAPSRHLMLTLATWADMSTATIPTKFTPSLTVLTNTTGLDRATVRRHLNRLERDGWVVRRRPAPEKARAEHARTTYRLTIPDKQAARGTEPLARGTEPPELGAESRKARGTVPLITNPYQDNHARTRARRDLTPATAAAEMKKILGQPITEQDAETAIRDFLQNANGAIPNKLRDFCKAVRDHPERYRPTPIPPRYKRRPEGAA